MSILTPLTPRSKVILTKQRPVATSIATILLLVTIQYTSIELLFYTVYFIDPIPCPSDLALGGCWTYDDATDTCALEPSCVKVDCLATKMTMSVTEAVFGAVGATNNGMQYDSESGYYTKDCNLGDSTCESHGISGTR